MAKVKLPVAGTVGKSVLIDPDANKGATLGLDLKLADGTIATAATLAAALGVGAAGDGDASPTLWKLIREIPANVIQVEGLNTAGLVTRLADGTWVTRSLDTNDGTFISISNPAGAAGNPSVDVDFDAAIAWGGAHLFGVMPMVWDGADFQEVALSPLGLADLSDVAIATPAEGQVLQYNASSTDWENTSLVDVSLTSVAAGHVLYYDGTEFVNTDAVSIDPAGAVELQYAGAKSLETDTNGAILYDPRVGTSPVGRQPLLWLKWQDGSNAVLLGNNAASESILRSYVPSANWLIEARNSADTANNKILVGNPDGTVELYHAGTKATETFISGSDGGLKVFGPGNINVWLADAAGNRLSQYAQSASGGTFIDNFENGGGITLRATSSAGALRTTLSASPDGSVSLYHAGTEMFRTQADGAILGNVTGDARLQIIADTNNVGEDNNPWVEFSQDGAAVIGIIGLNGDPGRIPDNTAVTGTHANYLSLGNKWSGGGVDFWVGGSGTIKLGMWLYHDGGLIVGTPTGGAKGAGTINAQAVYDDNTLLTDYVFDAELDGSVDLAKWDRAVPNRTLREEDGQGRVLREEIEERTHEPARRFAQRTDDLDPEAYAAKWRTRRKLPAFDDGDDDVQLSLGEYSQRLLETCEVQAIHIDKLLQRIAALEGARV